VIDTVNLAFAAEYRNEDFMIGAEQVESYTAGILGAQGLSTLSNGLPSFPGFPAVIAGSLDRANYAIYVEGDFDVTDDLLTQVALR
jgi:iron complex outermembrane receptor protein